MISEVEAGMRRLNFMVVLGSAALAAASLPAMAQLGVASGVASPIAGGGRVVSVAPRNALSVRAVDPAPVRGFGLRPGLHKHCPRFGCCFDARCLHLVSRKHGFGFKIGFGHKHGLHRTFFKAHFFPLVSNGVVISQAEPSTHTEQAPSTEVTLLALKNGTIYAVAQYWLDEGRIFYVTLNGTQDSFPINDLDLELTITLNAERGIGFLLRPAFRGHTPGMGSTKLGTKHLRVPVEIPKD